MIGRKISGRIKAAIVGFAVAVTAMITPMSLTMTALNAATTGSSITINKNLIASTDDSDSSTRQTRFKMSGLGNDAKSVTLNFTSSYKGNVTIGIGFNLKTDPYWYQAEGISVSSPGTSFSVTYKFPTDILSDINIASGEMSVAIWYPQAGESFNLTTASSDGSGGGGGTTGPVGIPETKNAKSGTWTFVDNKDGTATISSTLSKQIEGVDYTLTQGFDEDYYLDREAGGGDPYTEGEPINSHKFSYTDFGIYNMDSIQIESLKYIIESDTPMDQFMYGGGINVEYGSLADTELINGKNGYWYNDHGDEDETDYGFEIGRGVKVMNAGTYLEILWDVPKEVQPYVTMNPSDTASIQYWYGTSAENPEELAETVRVTSAVCTYTRTLTVPYNTTKNTVINKTLTFGDDTANKAEIMLADQKLGERDKISAIKFNLAAGADVDKFVGGLGISVNDEYTAVTTPNWYESGDFLVVDSGKNIEVMWLIPEAVRDYIDKEYGNIMFGAWYGDDAESITLKSADIYYFKSNEEDFVINNPEMNLEVGDTEQITANVRDLTYVSSNPNIATVDENGVVTAISEGITTITVTTPEGQSAKVTVNVSPKITTTTTVTTVTTTTTTTTTTVNPDEVIDWSKVKYGDVDLNGKIEIVDVVLLNKYLLNKIEFPLNATSRENSDCVYDSVLAANDSSAISKYLANIIPESDLGKQN